MVRVSAWTAMTMLVVAVGLTRPAGARPPAAAIRLGVLGGMFRDVPAPLVHAAATPLRDLFKKQTGLDSAVEVVEDHDVLAAKMQAKELHVGVFHGFEWAWVKDRHPDLVPLAVTIPPRRPEAVLVVKADAKAAAPGDLKGAVAVPLATKAHCHLFLERLTENLPEGCCVATRMPDSGPDDAMDAVADGKVAAALLDAGALTAYQNNRPGRAALLRVLARSDPFPPTVVVYRKDAIGADVAAKIQSGLVRTKTDPQGKAFLFLWKLKGFEEPPAGYDADLRAVAKQYPAPPAAGTTAMPE